MYSKNLWQLTSAIPACDLLKPKFHLARNVTSWHDTFDVLSQCILAVSSLSNSTARHFRLRNDLYCVEWGVKLYSLIRSSRRARHVERLVSRRDEPSEIWTLTLDHNPAQISDVHVSQILLEL